jgi:hypothetical protein
MDLWASKSGYNILKYELRSCGCTTVLISLVSTHLVKYSVAMMMYQAPVCFLGVLIGPTKSMAHFLNTCNVNWGAKGISSHLEGFPTLWHASQDL